MKNKIQYLFLFVFFLSLSPNIHGEGKAKDDFLTVYFEPGKFEVSDNKVDALIKKLDKSKKYLIKSYACKEDKVTDEALMGIAARRTEKIENKIVEHDFSNKNITTVAYDLSSECKATIIEAGDNKPYQIIQRDVLTILPNRPLKVRNIQPSKNLYWHATYAR